MENPFSLIWYVLFLPLAGSLIQALFGGAVVRRLGPAQGKRLMGTLAVLPIAAAFLIGVVLTQQLATMPVQTRHEVVTLFDWIKLQGLSIPFEALVDPLSMTMVLIITGVGALIHLYATGYMADDRDYTRFFTYLNLFIAFMLILVLGNNLPLLFIGWEGVGLCSYLLIGFWYKDLANARAANKAFIVNRIGDWGLMLGMFLLLVVLAGSKVSLRSDHFLSYEVIFANAVNALQGHPELATAIALLLFVGACGKSAQFPLYFWLPDAMAGPTPVSALIHAATMVTAGVYLVNRMHVLFELSPVASAVVAMVGAFTAVFAALIAFGQTDIKKVLAYSTVSQLGFMFIACGAGAYWAGMYHVTTHAFFKALLFLGAGAVIYAMAHEQDMRRYGNLIKYLPITAGTMIAGWLSISGVPGLAGFFSKEAILGGALGNEHAIAAGYNVGAVAGWIGLFAAMLTAWYMTRLTMLTFFGKQERWREIPAEEHHEAHAEPAHETHDDHAHEDPHGFYFTDEEMALRHEEHEHAHALTGDHQPKEVPPSMWITLVVLAVLSIGGGYVLHQHELLQKWLYPSGLAVLDPALVTGHPHALPLMALSIVAASLGLIAGWFVYRKGLPPRETYDESKWSPFRKAARNQFGYDAALMDAGVNGGREIGLAMWKGVDAGLIDGLVNGLAWTVGRVGDLVRRVQTGFVRSYALMMLLGGVGLLLFLLMEMRKIGGAQ